MRLHTCDFLIIDVAIVSPELMETAIGVMDAPTEEGCRPESAPELGAFTFVPPGSFSE
jgi:hypothetical protein